MHPERALRVINLADIPEAKRKFFPQFSAVFVRRLDREIVDVIQCFSNPFASSEKYHYLYYPDTVMFAQQAGDLATVEDLHARIDSVLDPLTPDDLII